MGRNIINASSILESSRGTPVILACGYTDMRKSVNGLSSIVENQLKLNPYQKVLFVFCNKQRNRLKVLVWEDNGYWLHLKRLERGHFKWPAVDEPNTMKLTSEEFSNLLQGPRLEQKLRRSEVLKSH